MPRSMNRTPRAGAQLPRAGLLGNPPPMGGQMPQPQLMPQMGSPVRQLPEQRAPIYKPPMPQMPPASGGQMPPAGTISKPLPEMMGRMIPKQPMPGAMPPMGGQMPPQMMPRQQFRRY